MVDDTQVGPDGSLTAPAHWGRIDFISDLHLDADHPHTALALRDYLASTPADAVFILGDLFELWVGDDMRLQAFESKVTRWLAAAGQRLWLGLMVGNRDFLLGPDMVRTAQAHALPDPLTLHAFGTRHLLTHGDAWCLEDTRYLQYREMVRDPVWQRTVIGLPFDQRVAMARGVRQASDDRKKEHSVVWADVDEAHAAAHMAQAQALSLIHGHTHRPVDQPFGVPGGQRHVLSDWNLDSETPRGEILSLTSGGLSRSPCAVPG